MPQLTLEVPHALGQAEALQRLKRQFSFAKETYQSHLTDLVEQWTDGTLEFSFRAAGMAISGTLAVEASTVQIHAELPWAAAIFKNMIEQRLREELEKLLS
jgi:predicted NBD/HSP70 family sugar kinase